MKGMLCVMLALGAGVASGYWGHGERPAAKAPNPLPPIEWPAASAEAPERDPDADPFAGIEVPDRDFPDLRTALAAIPAPERVTGDGTITVLVETSEGKPLADVHVTAIPRGYPRNRTPGLSLEEQVRDIVRHERWKRDSGRRGTTGPDGTLTLDSIGDAEYYLSARRTGYRIHQKEQAGNAYRFVAQALGRLEVRVVGPDGEPAEAAALFLNGDRSQHAWTPRNRVLELAARAYRVEATAGRFEELVAEPVHVQVPSDGTRAIATLRLERVSGIAGRIEGPMSGVRPSLYAVPAANGPPKTVMEADRTGRSYSFRFDELDFRFVDLAPGPYFVVLGVGWDTPPLVVRRVDVGDGIVECNLTVDPSDPAMFLHVEVRAPDGTPIDDASIELSCLDGDRSGASRHALALGGGRYAIQHCAPAGESGISTSVVVRHERFGERRFEYELPHAQVEVVQYRPLQPLTVSIDGFADSGHTGDVIAFLEPVRDPRERRTSFTWDGRNRPAPDGTWRWNAEPGEYQVWLYAEVGLWQLAYAPVRIDVGGAQLRMTLPPLHELRIENDGAIDTVSFRLADDPTSQLSGTVWPKGSVSSTILRALPAGRYLVTCNSSKEVEVTIPRAEPVRFKESR